MKRSEVIRAVAELTRELGRAPDISILSARLGQTVPTMQAAVQALVSERSLVEVSTGLYGIRPQDSQPSLFSEVPPAPETERAPGPVDPSAVVQTPAQSATVATTGVDVSGFMAEDRPAIATVAAQPERRGIGRIGRWQILTIRGVMGASGVAASVASGYFAIARLREFMPRSLAALLGTFIVAFAVLAFETVLVMAQRRSYFMAGLFVVLWGLTLAFTLNSTLAGFYSFFTSVKHEAAATEAPENANKHSLDSLVSGEEPQLRARIDVLTLDLQANERTVQDATSTVDERTSNARVLSDAQTRIAADGKSLDDLESRLQVVREKERALLEATPAISSTVSRADYFEWAAGLLHWQPATMEMVSALLPSAFVDLISSIGLAVALFL